MTPGSGLCSAVEGGAGRSRASADSAFLVGDFSVIRCDEHFSLSLDGEMWSDILGLLPQRVPWREPRVLFYMGLSEHTPRQWPQRQGKPQTASVGTISHPVTVSSASSERHHDVPGPASAVGSRCICHLSILHLYLASIYLSSSTHHLSIYISIIYHLSSICHQSISSSIIYLSVYLSTYLPTYLPIYPSIHQSST